MNQFARLLFELENTSKTLTKVRYLKHYFEEAELKDRVWAIALFTHKRPKRQINTRQLTDWAIELIGCDEWLFQESYAVVGDLAETLSLMIDLPNQESDYSLSNWIEYLEELKDLEEHDKKQRIFDAWNQLDPQGRFVFNKLITGGFRVGVSKNLIIRALAENTGKETSEIAHRLMGDWDPFHTSYTDLITEELSSQNLSKPYPFYLAYPLEQPAEKLGQPGEWIAEWKWDGIRSQLIKRNGELFIWSRGEELITDKFPEFEPLLAILPDGTVIDGELLPFKDDRPLSFSLLQTRIGRKNVSKKHLQEAPASIITYDLLEWENEDLRNRSTHERRVLLAHLLDNRALSPWLRFSKDLSFKTWKELTEIQQRAREEHAEGLMLKRKAGVYKTGRKRGDWWKWKVDPFTIDAVMIYAQKGHGRRADVYSDYTFAVWNGEELVPFAKAYSGLTDQEILEVTRFVRNNTLERFGPVRTVNAQLVFEIHFEGINESKRHKSGLAVRFPRIHRWRKDKKPEEANTLEELRALINS